MNPTISIVIPCYNEQDYIARCFEAILDQTEIPEEVIFVNNNSTDNSRQLAESFKQKFADKSIELHILEEKNNSQKQVLPRILGFKNAHGDLIGMIDVDTEISKNWVKTAKNEFSKNEKLCSLMGPYNFYNIDIFSKIGMYLCFILYTFTKYFYLMWGNNGVFRKKYFLDLNGLDDYWEMHRKLKLKYIYDDNFLSEKFKLIGGVKFSWSLRSAGEKRDQGLAPIKRIIDQPISFFRIKRYIKNKYKCVLKK